MNNKSNGKSRPIHELSRQYVMKSVIPVFLLGCLLTPLLAEQRDAAAPTPDTTNSSQTPIAKWTRVIEQAQREKAWGQLANAIVERVQARTDRNDPARIRLLEEELKRAPREIRPVLETLLAFEYWQHAGRDNNDLLDRTPTTEPAGNDFTTWDRSRLGAEVVKHLTSALADVELLKQIPIETFDALLEPGTVSKFYQPTLYDFLARVTLNFYRSDLRDMQTADDYDLPVDSPIFADTGTFLQWQRTLPFKQYPESCTLKSIDLYARLLAFHAHDADQTALADTDLARLLFGYCFTVGEKAHARYAAALDRFIARWSHHEIAALAMYDRALLLNEENKPQQAHRLLERAFKLFPYSVGGRRCRNLMARLESKELDVRAEQVWNNPAARITVHYRNLSRVYFRVISYDFVRAINEDLTETHSDIDDTNEAYRKMLTQKPVLEWSAPLSAKPDYRSHTDELSAPTSLQPGFYFLLTSSNPQFDSYDNQIRLAYFWVCNLALVTRSRDGHLEGFVTDATSGEPVTGAKVNLWPWGENGVVKKPELTTDTNGAFITPIGNDPKHLLFVEHGDQLFGQNDLWLDSNRSSRDPSSHRVIFLTDRALYRPGQVIHFKGICLRTNPADAENSLLPHHEIEVLLTDCWDAKIAKLKCTSNDYGSFCGTFTIPSSFHNRTLRIKTAEQKDHAEIKVEEYKRPKFEVTLSPPLASPRLDDKVRIQGKATCYNGTAADGAHVSWRVERAPCMPAGGTAGHPSFEHLQKLKVCAQGNCQADKDGHFNIEFTAQPGSVYDLQPAAWQFQISAEVTDSNGETRTADCCVIASPATLEVSVSANDWQTETQPVELDIKAFSINAQPQSAAGIVRIHRLKQPDRVHRTDSPHDCEPFPISNDFTPHEENPPPGPDSPASWELGEFIRQQRFQTSTAGVTKLRFGLKAGIYRAVLETKDRFGAKVHASCNLRVLNPDASRLNIRIPNCVTAPRWTAQAGATFQALWGTGYDCGRAVIEIEYKNKILKRYWTPPGQTQHPIQFPVPESMRGEFILHVTQVRENRAYLFSQVVPIQNQHRDLRLRWEHFTSKLQPNQKETWTAVIQKQSEKPGLPPNLEAAAAEMAATLYDASLDAYQALDWSPKLGPDVQRSDDKKAEFANETHSLRLLTGKWQYRYIRELLYRRFPNYLIPQSWGYGAWRLRREIWPTYWRLDGGEDCDLAEVNSAYNLFLAKTEYPMVASASGPENPPVSSTPIQDSLNQIVARKNLNETAFFYPHLLSDSNGTVRISFTMPETLTRWRFLGFAHDKQLRVGRLEGEAVTTKDLMTQPNPPRFLREGDTVEFPVKVTNPTGMRQTGQLRLTFTDAQTGQSVDRALDNQRPELTFDIPAQQSRSYFWRIHLPDKCGMLTYKAVAASERFSDGEEGWLPVLPRRILVTESLPLPIRGPATKTFQFTKLLQSGQSDSLRHQSLTLQMVSNPSWYAVLALPYLMEFPHECCEQTFNRLYANALARHIVNSDPKARQIFEQWQKTTGPASPLESNPELKSVLIEETPWLREARAGTAAYRQLARFFDPKRLDREIELARTKLKDQQLRDGSWPWFTDGKPDSFITLYISTGFCRLRRLGSDIDMTPAIEAFQHLDYWMLRRYENVLRTSHPEQYVPDSLDALYLYGRSFILKDKPIRPGRNPIGPDHKAMIDFLLHQSRTRWQQTGCRQTKAHLAIALSRFGGEINQTTARTIMKSIKEQAVVSEELGMYWPDSHPSWWWYQAPIETQALMIEAFDEVLNDASAVQDCRTWLLKQKQTQNWKTTKATADAIYSLLLHDNKIVANPKLVEVSLGGTNITPSIQNPKSEIHNAVEAGTGFYQKRFGPDEIKPALASIVIKKTDDGIAWGSLHWQYLEDIAKVSAHEETPLKLKKRLYVKLHTANGPVLQPVTGPLQVGDELVVRLELRADRDMEYVHLKDQRGSGTEPVNVLSGYRFQDGLAYYENTRDTASHFFIDYLRRGTYIFEYSSRIQLRGQYQSGIAEIQCMYAPEFNSHSESMAITVK